MGKIGFIGFGAMGGVLAKALIERKAILEKNVILTTRTPAKLKDFITHHSEIEVADSIRELVQKSDRVFICTGTREVKAVLTELAKLSKDIHIITITGAIDMECLESVFPGRISRIMPTQIAEVGEGVTLLCHNAKTLPEDHEFLTSAFGKIGKVKEITEEQMDLAANLSSCAPAFYAAIMQNLTETARNHGSLTSEEIKEICLATAYGTFKLLSEKDINFAVFVRRVATPGGITEEGVKILDSTLPDIFDEVFNATLAKRRKIKQEIRKQYELK